MRTLIILNWCYGIARPYSPVFCQDVHKVGQQIKRCAHLFDRTFIFNDCHSEIDLEFKYIPPHMIEGSPDRQPLDLEGFRRVYLAHKLTMSAFRSEHSRKILLRDSPDEVMLSGFNGLTDIIPTCIDLIHLVPKIFVAEQCFGDLSIPHKERAVEYLQFLNVSIIRGEVNDKSFGVQQEPSDTVRSVS